MPATRHHILRRKSVAIGGPHRTVAATRGGPSLFSSATLIRSPATLLVTTSSIVPVDPRRCRSPRRFSTARDRSGCPSRHRDFSPFFPFPRLPLPLLRAPEMLRNSSPIWIKHRLSTEST